jgi:hypothetical protein
MTARRVTGLVVSAAFAASALAAPAALAHSSRQARPAVKVPPACVQHKLPAGLNLKVGYCPN